MESEFQFTDLKSWADIPTKLLREELSRRQQNPDRPVCGGKNRGSYNTAIHVGALILVLVLSVAGEFLCSNAVLPADTS